MNLSPKNDEALGGAVGGSQVAARLSFTLCGVTLAVASQLGLDEHPSKGTIGNHRVLEDQRVLYRSDPKNEWFDLFDQFNRYSKQQ